MAKLESVNQEFCWLFGFLCEDFDDEEEGEDDKKEKESKKKEQEKDDEKKPILEETDDYDSLITVEETGEEKRRSLSINEEIEGEKGSSSLKLRKEDSDDVNKEEQTEEKTEKEKIEKKKRKDQKKKRELQYCRTYVNWVLFSLIFLVIPYGTIVVWNEFNQLDRPFTCPSPESEVNYYIRNQQSPVSQTTFYILDLISEKNVTFKKDYPVVYGIVNLLEALRPSGKKHLPKEDIPDRFICDLTNDEVLQKNLSTSVVSFVKIQSFSLLVFFVRSIIDLFVVVGAVLAFRKPIMKVLASFSKVGCTLYMFQWVSELLIILIFSFSGFTLFIVQIIEFLSDGRAILPNSMFTFWLLILEVIVVWRAGLCYSYTHITCTKKWWYYMIIEPWVKLQYVCCGSRKGWKKVFCGVSLCCMSWFLFFFLQFYVLPRLIIWGFPPFIIPNFIAIPVFNQVISIIDVLVIVGMYISCGCGICLREAWNEEGFKHRRRYRRANFTSSFNTIRKKMKREEEMEDHEDAEGEEEEVVENDYVDLENEE